MNNKNCMLCGQPLRKGERINREHYVPATAIRNFNKLRVPSKWDYALRIDLREDGSGDILLAPRSSHKEWATVLTHEKCNTDASHMCQDMKYIIDHPHNYPRDKEDSIISYYAHIWGIDEEYVEFWNISDEELEEFFEDCGDGALIYEPGYMWIGKIYVGDAHSEGVKNDQEQHTIILGTKAYLNDIIDEFRTTGKVRLL